MLVRYKDRSLVQGQQVKIYFNLHTQLFSIKDCGTGLVVAHGNGIMVEDIEFRVHQAGRERVLREKKKNVHAFVIGKYVGTAPEEVMSIPMRDAYYNPYKQDSFTDSKTDRKLSKAAIGYLNNKKVKYL